MIQYLNTKTNRKQKINTQTKTTPLNCQIPSILSGIKVHRKKILNKKEEIDFTSYQIYLQK